MAQAYLIAEATWELLWLERGCRVCRFNIRAFGWQLEKAHRDGGKEVARQESAKMLA